MEVKRHRATLIRELNLLKVMLDYDQVTIKGLTAKTGNRRVSRDVARLVKKGLVYTGDPIDIDLEMDDRGLLTGENRQLKTTYIVNYNMAVDRIDEIEMELYDNDNNSGN